jgi:large subunit ribosomal protein L7/L12
MAELTKEKVIEFIKKMSVLELNEFVKDLEKEFGVSAQAAMPVMVQAGAQGGAQAPAQEEKTEFTVTLKEVGADKIKVIKVLREVTNLGLKEAKELVDKAPGVIKENVSKEEAESIKKKFEEVGAKVELK